MPLAVYLVMPFFFVLTNWPLGTGVHARVYNISLPQPLFHHAATAVGSIVVVAGGTNGIAVLDTVFAFNATSNQVVQISPPNLSVGRCNMGVSVVASKIYLIGGTLEAGNLPTTAINATDLIDVSTLNVTQNLFQKGIPQNFFLDNGVHGGSSNNLAVFAGGLTTSTNTGSSVLAWNGTTKVNLPNMTRSRGYMPGVAVEWQGHVYSIFAGGSDYSGKGVVAVATIDIYNHSSGQRLNTTVSLSSPRHGMRAVVVNQTNATYVVFVGGTESGNGVNGTGVIDVMFVSNFSMMNLSLNLAINRSRHAASLLGAYIYVFGGLYNDRVGGGQIQLDSVEVIDTRTWDIFPGMKLSTALQNLASVSTREGIFVLGGRNGPASNLIHIYTCGNEVIDEGEVCDDFFGFCFRNCTACLPGYYVVNSTCVVAPSPTPVPALTPVLIPDILPSPINVPPPVVPPPQCYDGISCDVDTDASVVANVNLTTNLTIPFMLVLASDFTLTIQPGLVLTVDGSFIVSAPLSLGEGSLVQTNNDFVADSTTIHVVSGSQIIARNCLNITNTSLVIDANHTASSIVFSSETSCLGVDFQNITVLGANSSCLKTSTSGNGSALVVLVTGLSDMDCPGMPTTKSVSLILYIATIVPIGVVVIVIAVVLVSVPATRKKLCPHRDRATWHKSTAKN